MLAFFRALSLPGKIGLIGGLLGGLAGLIVATIASPIVGAIFTVIIVAVFYISWRFAFAPIARREALRTSGKPAEATILAVEDTGWTVNEIYPVIKLRLEVRPPNGPPFQTEIREMINRMDIPSFQVGAVVPVLYDPKNHDNVSVGAAEGTVEGLVNTQTMAQDPERARQMEEFLTKADQRNQAVLATGKPAKAKILNAWEMGVFVNGNNPAKTFLLEVQPDGEPSFQAQTIGVILEASVPKYMPGKEIYIKYDPNDKSHVSIDHS